MSNTSTGRQSAGPAAIAELTKLERFERKVMLPAMLGATLLFLLGSFANFLPTAGMSLFEPTALTSFGLLALFGMALASLLTLAGPAGQAALLGLLAFAITGLHVPAIDPLVALPLGMAAGFWKPRAIARLIGVIFAVVLVTAIFASKAALFDEAASGTPTNGDLPPLLHVIVDEIGPETGLPGDRFSQWTAAHSRYHVTKASLPEMTDDFYATLLDRGYDLEIRRTDYVRSCPEGARCARHRNFHFAPLREGNFPLLRKAQVTIYAWIRTGQNFETLADRVDPMVGASHVSPLTSLNALDRSIDRAADLQSGEALSVHVLLPHYPYILDRQCALKPYRQWVGRSPAFPVDDRRSAYADQLACLTGRLADIGRDDMVIVIHGDHGTRYFDVEVDGADGSRRDALLDQAFATAFALHSPSIAPQQVDRPASVSSLLEELATSQFDGLPEGRQESVFIGEKNFAEINR